MDLEEKKRVETSEMMGNDDHEVCRNNVVVSEIVEEPATKEVENSVSTNKLTSIISVNDSEPCYDTMKNIVTDQRNVVIDCEKNVERMIDNEYEENQKNTESEKPASSLSFIALAYDNSDSESEECKILGVKNNPNVSNPMEIQISKEYRNVPQTTIDDDTDSDESSDVVDSDSSSDTESERADDNSDGSDGPKTNKNGKKQIVHAEECRRKESKGEYDDLPPIEELKISVPEVLCDPLGEVAWMVEQMVVVRPKPGKPTLNIDTVLFIERGRRVLGRIFDVFGQVSDPHYCVRFNSTEHIEQSDIKVAMTVYFCPNTEYTSVVFLQDLLKMKATDELGDDEHPEFSDDEEERAYYAGLKQKQKIEKTKTGESAVPQKRHRTDAGWKSNNSWMQSRKQDESTKPDRSYNSPVLPGGTRQNCRNPSPLWQQHSHTYQNIMWPPTFDNYQANGWRLPCPPQNPYGYSAPYHPFGPPAAAPRSFQTQPYSQRSNPLGHPSMNFPCQSPLLRQPVMSWRFPPPPPPPPPPPGM